MAEVINAKAILSNLSAGEKSCWRLVPTGITTADVDDEGVWIEKNGVVVKRGEVLFSSNAKIKVSFGALALDEGIYDLCVATRNGASASNGISARKLTRKVTIHV